MSKTIHVLPDDARTSRAKLASFPLAGFSRFTTITISYNILEKKT